MQRTGYIYRFFNVPFSIRTSKSFYYSRGTHVDLVSFNHFKQ